MFSKPRWPELIKPSYLNLLSPNPNRAENEDVDVESNVKIAIVAVVLVRVRRRLRFQEVSILKVADGGERDVELGESKTFHSHYQLQHPSTSTSTK